MSITVIYKLILSFLMSVARHAKVLKITSMQCLCNISRKNWVMKLMFCMMINMKVFYELILFLMGLARYAQITRVNLQYFCEILRKKPGMKWGINCTGWFKCYFIIHPVFSHHWPFMGQYGIHIKSFIHLINCLYNISLLLLFQVTVGPYNFFFFFFF